MIKFKWTIPGFEGKSAHQSQVVRSLALVYLGFKANNPNAKWSDFINAVLANPKLSKNDTILAAINDKITNDSGDTPFKVTKALVEVYYKKYTNIAEGIDTDLDELISLHEDDNAVEDTDAQGDSETKETHDKKSITENHTLKLGREVKKLLFFIPMAEANADGSVSMNGDNPAKPLRSEIRLPEILTLEEVTTYLQGQLSGNAPSWKKLKSVMQQLVKYKPWVQVIISRLEDKVDDKGNVTEDRSQQRAQFVRWATKHYVDLKIGLWDTKEKYGSTYYNTTVISADQNNIIKYLKNEFNESLRRDTDIVKITRENGVSKETVNKELLQDIYVKFNAFIAKVKADESEIEVDGEKTTELLKELASILNSFGVSADEEILRKFLIAANSGQLKTYTSAGGIELPMWGHIANPNGVFFKMSEGIRKLLDKIDRFEEKKESEFKLSAGSNPLWDNHGINDYINFYAQFIDTAFTNSYRNGSNDTVWSYSNNKEDINRLRELLETRSDSNGLAARLIEHSAYHSSSNFLKRLIDEPQFANYTKIVYMDSIRQRTAGKGYKAKPIDKMSPKELSVFKMMSLFNQGRSSKLKAGFYRLGTLFNMTMRDKPVLMGLQTVLHNTSVGLVQEGQEIVDVRNNRVNTNALKKIIQAEVDRINAYLNALAEGITIDNKGYSTGAGIFFLLYLPKTGIRNCTTNNLEFFRYERC